jgi:hypothetical protein
MLLQASHASLPIKLIKIKPLALEGPTSSPHTVKFSINKKIKIP